MPSKNMLPKGKRRQSVRGEYRAHRTRVEEERAAARAAGEFATGPADPEAFETADWEMPQPPAPGSIVTTGARGSKVAEEEESAPRYADPRLAEGRAAVALPSVVLQQAGEGLRALDVPPEAAGMRLDAFLARALPDISRARVQLLIEKAQVRVGGTVEKASYKLEGGEHLEIEGEPQPEPLRAEPEAIPLRVVYEDADLAVIDKPAGMMVHAGSGSPEHNRGTLVNALLHHFGRQLSSAGGVLRPGIVHRLDKETSGLIVVAKNDATHRKLAEMFAGRQLRKVYVALVHGSLKDDAGTIALPIGRDLRRRNRMTTRRADAAVLSLTGPGYPGAGDSGPQEDFEEEESMGGPFTGRAAVSGGSAVRAAVSHYRVLERLETIHGPFTLVEVHIETGRTHQIRVHMQALGHPVVGDTLYGAPARILPQSVRDGRASGSGRAKQNKRTGHASVEQSEDALELGRNFLHAAELDLQHPRTRRKLELRAALPPELEGFLAAIRRSV